MIDEERRNGGRFLIGAGCKGLSGANESSGQGLDKRRMHVASVKKGQPPLRSDASCIVTRIVGEKKARNGISQRRLLQDK
jgi:hypothetical protein